MINGHVDDGDGYDDDDYFTSRVESYKEMMNIIKIFVSLP